MISYAHHCAWLSLLLLPGPGGHAFGQQPQLAHTSQVTNADGSTSVFSRNSGFAPYTVYLRADLRHMASSVPLPARIVVFPGPKPQLLTTFTPEPGQPYYFRYHAPNQIGIYTGQLPDTAYVYGLPYRPAAPDEAPRLRTGNGPGYRYPYFFQLPAGTAICAAREGIVVTLRQQERRNRGASANYVIVIHDDGSYAWYQNLRQQSATVRIGQHVAQGDVLGYSCAEGDNPELYFTVNYPGPVFETIETAPVVFRVGTRVLRPQ